LKGTLGKAGDSMVLDFSGSVNSPTSNQVPANSEEAISDLKLKVDTKG
jgi:hypothetical protein